MFNNGRGKIVIESIFEVLIAIKRLGVPFVILGILFIFYSLIEGKPVIPFRNFIILFLAMGLFQNILENIWLEREIENLKEEINRLKKM